MTMASAITQTAGGNPARAGSGERGGAEAGCAVGAAALGAG